MYGTPFFIQASLPLDGEKRTIDFDRLVIAQDTGSAIVGPARADIYWGAGDRAGQIAGRLRHPGKFAMLVPRELDPVAAGAQMPLPPAKPPPVAKAGAKAPSPKSPHPVSFGDFVQERQRRAGRPCEADEYRSCGFTAVLTPNPTKIATSALNRTGRRSGQLRQVFRMREKA